MDSKVQRERNNKMSDLTPHNDPYKKKCLSCVMSQNDCMLYRGFENLIKDCPCLRCLVKITCTFDDVCDAYSEFMDSIYSDKKLERKIEEYEKTVSPYYKQHTMQNK